MKEVYSNDDELHKSVSMRRIMMLVVIVLATKNETRSLGECRWLRDCCSSSVSQVLKLVWWPGYPMCGAQRLQPELVSHVQEICLVVVSRVLILLLLLFLFLFRAGSATGHQTERRVVDQEDSSLSPVWPDKSFQEARKRRDKLTVVLLSTMVVVRQSVTVLVHTCLVSFLPVACRSKGETHCVLEEYRWCVGPQHTPRYGTNPPLLDLI